MFLINRTTIQTLMAYSEEIRLRLEQNYLDYILDYLALFMSILIMAVIIMDICTKFVKLVDDEEQRFIDVLPRPIIVLLSLLFYKQLVTMLIVTPADFFYEITKVGVEAVERNSYGEHVRDVVQEMLSWSGSNQNSDFAENKEQGYVGLIATIVQFFALCCGAFVVFRSIVAANVMYMMGPFILVLSLIPGNQVVIKKFWMGYLGILLWPSLVMIVFAVITILPYYYNKTFTTGNGTSPGEFLSYVWGLVLQIIGIYSIFAVVDYSRSLVYIASSAAGNGLGEGYQRLTQGAAKYLSHSTGRAIGQKFGLNNKLKRGGQNMKKLPGKAFSSMKKAFSKKSK